MRVVFEENGYRQALFCQSIFKGAEVLVVVNTRELLLKLRGEIGGNCEGVARRHIHFEIAKVASVKIHQPRDPLFPVETADGGGAKKISDLRVLANVGTQPTPEIIQCVLVLILGLDKAAA